MPTVLHCLRHRFNAATSDIVGPCSSPLAHSGSQSSTWASSVFPPDSLIIPATGSSRLSVGGKERATSPRSMGASSATGLIRWKPGTPFESLTVLIPMTTREIRNLPEAFGGQPWSVLKFSGWISIVRRAEGVVTNQGRW